ncbi:MAG: hypothetical protein FWE28_08530 [Oscillospiraceae bacterium]|nr:hypothetical protein [Oscillospiraceae bacterium]
MEEQKSQTPSAYDDLSFAFRELCEVMEHTQTMYHHLFVQTLHVKDSMQTAMRKLQEQGSKTV